MPQRSPDNAAKSAGERNSGGGEELGRVANAVEKAAGSKR